MGEGADRDDARPGGAAVIELRDVVVAPGAAPISATIRRGEVIAIDGPAPLASALCDVLAGRRAAHGGAIVWSGARSVVLVRAGDRLPEGIAPAASLGLLAALAGSTAASTAGGSDPEALAAARGLAIAPSLWLVDGALGPAAEAVIQRAADELRVGSAAMLWTTGGDPRRARVDQTIVVSTGGAPAATRSETRAAPGRRTIAAGPALARYAAAAASSRAALALAAVLAVAIALIAWTVAAHEGFWFAPGTAVALDQVARLAVAAGALAAATAAAARTAAAPRWPAMLHDTGAPRWQRWLALGAADLAGALLTTIVAAVPTAWALTLGRASPSSALLPVAVLLAALAAGTSTRALRATPLAAATGALVGAAAAFALLW